MKKIRIVTIFLLCIFLSGCREYGEKRIVKLITVDRENIAVYYYDYSSDKPSYLKEEKENNGIENTIVELLSENEYDLKLCKYAVCDTETVEKEAYSLYRALMDAKFSPDIVITEGDTQEKPEKYIELKQKNYPVYSYFVKANSMTGIIEKTDENVKNVIINSRFYKTLDAGQSFVFDMLTNNVKKGIYAFDQNGKKMSAVLERISTFYTVKDRVLNISVSANLKSYKGMAANEESKAQFAEILQKNIISNVTGLLADNHITENFDLLWYGKSEDFDRININVNII